MSLHIRLYGINSENDFIVSYKSGETLNSETTGFTSYDSYVAGTTGVTISGVTLSYNTNYWVKIQDSITNRYIIENIVTHEDCYFGCYDSTPTPTPTITPTPTPTFAVNSATICIGDGTTNACLCNRTVTVYFIGTLKEGVTLYTTSALTTKYFDSLYPNINYQNKLYTYPLGGGPLVANGICVTPTPTPTPITPTPTPTPITPTPTSTPITPTPTPTICNNILSMNVNSGIGGLGEGYIESQIILESNVSGNTVVEIKTNSAEYGEVFVDVTILAGENYGYTIDYRGVSYAATNITACVNDVTGDSNILCETFKCEANSCPCNLPTPTPTPTLPPTTPTPTPTPIGYCVELTNVDSFTAIDVTYINTSGIESCVLVPAASMVTVCVKHNELSNIHAFENGNGTCSGTNNDTLIVTNPLMTGCTNNGDCNPLT